MKINFKHPADTKNLVIGIFASLFGVIVWEIIRERKLWGTNETIEEELENN